jgi:predicted DNA-binding protein
MARTQLNVRISEGLAQELDKESNNTGRSKTWIVSAALSKYLDLPHEAKDVELLAKRVDRLEAQLKEIRNSGEDSRTKTSEPMEDYSEKELITMNQAADLTGYAVGTLRSNFSRNNITAKDRQGKKGLYSKAEILNKLGKR